MAAQHSLQVLVGHEAAPHDPAVAEHPAVAANALVSASSPFAKRVSRGGLP
jgi:hypothetical protein